MKGVVKSAIITFAAAMVLTTGSGPAQAQVARNAAEFCGVWVGICQRTCPQGRGNCTAACNQRRDACYSNGCYFFNVPGPRCFSNAEDLRLTDAALAPDPARERARRGIK